MSISGNQIVGDHNRLRIMITMLDYLGIAASTIRLDVLLSTLVLGSVGSNLYQVLILNANLFYI